MKSKVSKAFLRQLQALPPDIQRQAREAYELFKQDPYHNSLRFKEVDAKAHRYSVRIGRQYRALGIRDPKDVIRWYWIGSHADYDDLV